MKKIVYSTNCRVRYHKCRQLIPYVTLSAETIEKLRKIAKQTKAELLRGGYVQDVSFSKVTKETREVIKAKL